MSLSKKKCKHRKKFQGPEHSLKKLKTSKGKYLLNAYGICLENGKRRGIPRDPNKAFKKYNESAKMGYAHGQYNLARCYTFGIGTEIDEVKARHFYTLASTQGLGDAHNELGWFLLKGIGGDKDVEAAAKLFLLATKHEHSSASFFNVANCYRYGKGVQINATSAMIYYERAIEEADKEETKSDELGATQTLQDLKQTKSEALRELGLCYWDGVCGYCDIDAAENMFQRAKLMGCSLSSQMLSALEEGKSPRSVLPCDRPGII